MIYNVTCMNMIFTQQISYWLTEYTNKRFKPFGWGSSLNVVDIVVLMGGINV